MSLHNVLLIDDDKDFIETVAERLIARGMRVEVAYKGEEALEKLEKRSFDAVILDMVMPGMDGFETLKRILAVDPDLQVILLTGQATVEKSVEALKKGATDFLQKPPDFQQILAKIQQAATKKMLLVEKRAEDQIADIVFRRGW